MNLTRPIKKVSRKEQNTVPQKISYREFKILVLNLFKECLSTSQFNDLDALVTHWIQLRDTDAPYIELELAKILSSFFNIAVKQTGVNVKTKSTFTEFSNIREFMDWKEIPFPPIDNYSFKFIDLFCGIGGFRLAMQDIGGACVFSSEWDKHAKETYEINFGEVPFGDITNIQENQIPDHDILCAGFPCQPFSLAGVSARNAISKAHGFACETQGTLFFDIVRIVKEKMPKVLFLENVKNLVGHDSGNTFKVIRAAIEKLGYHFEYKIISANTLVPQNRVRCYMVCTRSDFTHFKFPNFEGDPLPLKSILEKNVDIKHTLSDKMWEGHIRRTSRNIARGVGFTAHCADINRPSNTIVSRYYKDGKECLIAQEKSNPRLLTTRECARLQGFPENYIIHSSRSTAYKQFGNSVAVPIVTKIGKAIIQQLFSTEIAGK